MANWACHVRVAAPALAAWFCACASLAVGNPIPDSERWATITHPGNVPYVFTPPGEAERAVGRVDYAFEISRTEVTGEEWFEFVLAYAPFVHADYARSSEFTSLYIHDRDSASGITYELVVGGENRAVEVGWRFAARYVNWLHNGKALTQQAFENGVYDTSTFGGSGSEGYTDQLYRAPDARYWLPSRDEWTKAVYFDPDRFGLGQPGYWLYPHASDSPPIPGVPGVGETSAGMSWFGMAEPEVAAYLDVQSPWGLWDGSGGVREWSGDPILDSITSQQLGRWTMTTRAGSTFHAIRDMIGSGGGSFPFANQGVRIARAIPEPASIVSITTLLWVSIARRRRLK